MKFRVPSRVCIIILVAASMVISFLFRSLLPFDQVFGGAWVKFTSVDAYYQMHLVDNIVSNFPHLTSFDPYLIYPGGTIIGGINFFNFLLGGIAWIVGLGSPTSHTVDVIGVYFPVVLAALTVIPVYFIGNALFNRWVGVLAAGLMAVFPGEYLGRSILGFTDYHVAETLLSTLAVLFLILAVKEATRERLTLKHILQRNWATISRFILYSLLSGLFLGIYMITWPGGLLFTFIITLYLIIQFVLDHLRGKSTEYLGITGFILFLVAAVIFIPLSHRSYYPIAMVVAVLIPPVLAGLSKMLSNRGIKPFYYLVAMAGLVIIFLGIFYVISGDILGRLLSAFKIFVPTGASATTTLEMQPFLFPQGSFSTLVAWGNFTTSFFLFRDWPVPGFALISFFILIYLFIKYRGDDSKLLLFLLWSLVIIILTLAQRRFAYYLVVNMALLSAYFSWQVIWLAGLRKLVSCESTETDSSRRKRTGAVGGIKVEGPRRAEAIYFVNVVLAILVVFVFVFLFNVVKAKDVAAQARFAPSDAWEGSLHWLKENTPEPMGDPDAYYGLYAAPAEDEDFQYPESAYGVTSWWDYGYWITRTAHRIPTVNPSQASEPIRKVASLFLSTDESRAGELMEELDSNYIIEDYDMVTSKFWAIATWAGQPREEYFSLYYFPYEGEMIPVQFFNPLYYQTLIVRLYNFNAEEVTKVNPIVITYDEEVSRSGVSRRQVRNIEEFSNYQEALDFVQSEGPSRCSIVGADPFVSPVPLEAVEDYRLIYSSKGGISQDDGSIIPEVKIFEYN